MSFWAARALRRAQEEHARRSIVATAIVGTLIMTTALVVHFLR